ncbi:sodium:solute symporter family transporter [Poriferisphaera sp. WC338]|uniref:sodium:solute symporter family transporter n=1 Tax=Poriferisphaera sp. WC338 TaxID=3425129 RepID=UPI003D81A25D
MPALPDPVGVASPFVGIHNDALIVAGGANFPEASPWNGGKKVWTDAIHVMTSDDKGTKIWRANVGKLPHPVAYGVSITTEDGVLMIGGSDQSQCYSDVLQVSWDGQHGIMITQLPPMPRPLAFATGACVGDTVYVAGGQVATSSAEASSHFFSLDLSKQGSDEFAWKEEATWPGPPRVLAVSAVQNEGKGKSFYLFSGRNVQPGSATELLSDAYRFDHKEKTWEKLPDIIPDGESEALCMMAATALNTGTYGIYLMGGDHGEEFMVLEGLNKKIAEEQDHVRKAVLQKELVDRLENHGGFAGTILAFNTVTKTYARMGKLPSPSPVTMQVVRWGDKIVIPSGEVRPGVRSPNVWSGQFIGEPHAFGWLNYTVLIVYLLGMLVIGFYISGRGGTTEDFFLAGKRIPWWAAGLSIFSTQLSAITFIAIPAKTFATDWTYLALNGTILLSAPIAIYLFLPFFCRLNVTTAYEYLEMRFNMFARMIASAMFMFFQVGRIGIVLFLPSIALALATNLPVEICILIMGAITIVYTVMGGIEAVIWTDVIQTVVLLGGAGVCLFIMISGADNPWSNVQLGHALDAGKLKAVNLMFRLDSPTLWVLLMGGIAGNIIGYGTDQSVIQRYLTTKNQGEAAKGIWTSAMMAIPATLLFFALGTGMYLFYHSSSNHIDPNLVQSDAVLPLFITQNCPAGIAGLIIAGIFAAAMSSLDSSMNSVATAFTTDFYARLLPDTSDKNRLGVAKTITVLVGIFGTVFALVLAMWDIKSLWDSLSAFVGLFAGGIGGVFLLGMLSKRANGIGAVMGLIASGGVQYAISTYTDISVILYAFTGMVSCIIAGYVFSILTFKTGSRNGFTIHPDLTVWRSGEVESITQDEVPVGTSS